MRKRVAWTTRMMMIMLAMAAAAMGADVAQLTVTLGLDGRVVSNPAATLALLPEGIYSL